MRQTAALLSIMLLLAACEQQNSATHALIASPDAMTTDADVSVHDASPDASEVVDSDADAANDATPDASEVAPLDLGPQNGCPSALIEHRPYQGGGWAGEGMIAGTVGDILDLSGASSSDPDGDALALAWALIEGDPQALEMGATPDAARLTLTRAEVTVVELLVTDTKGCAAAARLTVEATYPADQALVIELSWSTAVDVDLHLVRAGGFWDDRFTGTDCHFRNCSGPGAGLDWGAAGSPADNPRMLYDSQAYGPEVIVVEQPATTSGAGAAYDAPYRVGAYYYDDHGEPGPTDATVRVWLDGVLRVDRSRSLASSDRGLDQNAGDMWIVGEIDVPTGGAASFMGVDMIVTGFP